MPTYQVRNSSRAFIVALIPVAILHAVLTAMATAGSQAQPPVIALPSPDAAFVRFSFQLAIDAVLLFAGHRLLQSRLIAGRLAYVAMGGIMTGIGYVVALRYGLHLAAPAAGSVVTAGVLPMLAGMVAGFLYHQLAGLVAVAAPSSARSGESLRFEGPVRVRTSLAASGIAALVPAVLASVLFFTVAYGTISGAHEPSGATWSRQIMAFALPAQMFLTTLITTFVPSVILTLVAHFIARALGRRRIFEYAAVGAGVGLALALVATPFSPFTSSLYTAGPALVCGAIMGALYRRFAGLEPLPLPEVLVVEDEAALVGDEHTSRRGHPVMLGN